MATQQQALEILKQGGNVFLTGEPGSGKTHTIGMFIEYLDKKGMDYAVTASTGIAASHINGSTIHSFAGIGILKNLTTDQVRFIALNRWVADRIRNAKVLIIDEISMLDATTLEDVDKVIKMVHGNPKPFGGVQVIFVGDFYQLPPVTKGEKQTFAFESDAWIQADPTVCYLTEQHRQSDAEFLDILTAMRQANMTDAHKKRLEDCMLSHVPDTRLFTHNADVDALNNTELNKLPGKNKTNIMHDRENPKLIEVLKRNCLSPERLELKVGAVVMFTRNNFKEGYVNGTIGKVTAFIKGDPIVTLTNGKRIRPEYAEWNFMERKSVKAYIRQMPLKLAWAITIHKSQGMSLDQALVDLSQTFEYGQGYVAISRVRSLSGLHLKGTNPKAYQMHPRVIEQDEIFRSKSI